MVWSLVDTLIPGMLSDLEMHPIESIMYIRAGSKTNGTHVCGTTTWLHPKVGIIETGLQHWSTEVVRSKSHANTIDNVAKLGIAQA